jgi:integrase
MATGIRKRGPGQYEAWVWSKTEQKKIRKTFPTHAAASSWRTDAAKATKDGRLRAPTRTTVREAWETWLAGAREGTIRNRSGDQFKPSVIRSYRQVMNQRVIDELGALRLSELTHVGLQDFADGLVAQGLDASTVRNTVMPIRVLLRRAVARGELAVNPAAGLTLPAVRGRRDRFASPAEAAALLGALGESERPIYATALYGGLRRGELMALRLEDIDLKAGLIRVERAYDPEARVFTTPKTRAGSRTVPIPAVLREHLAAQRLRSGRVAGLAFGATAEQPFEYVNLIRRAARAWKLAGLEPIGLHSCRHTFASLMIAAGVNAKTLSTYMGHSSISITLDRYGHLMPGNEQQAAAMLDSYLTGAETGASR